VLCANTGDLPPYSESMAQASGWRRRVPLQHCLESAHVYCSDRISDDEAAATLLADLPGRPLTEPRLLRLSTGRPTQFWTKNCIALAGSSLEPLEGTGLHLVQTGITRLVAQFPARRFSPLDIEEYNRVTAMEYERIRDFLILHYKATQRSDSPFWEHCGHMDIPDTLRAKIGLFKDSARLAMFDEEHFGEDSWLTLLIGQNLSPEGYDPLADVLDINEVRAALLHMRSMIQSAVDTMPLHSQFVAAHCLADADGIFA
jgi:tryptophan halogenase